MTSTTVAQFAAELKMPADVLLEQLKSAGVSKTSEADAVTEADKGKLLESLRKAHGSESGQKKITLTRKQTSEIKQAGPGGRAVGGTDRACRSRGQIEEVSPRGLGGSGIAHALRQDLALPTSCRT